MRKSIAKRPIRKTLFPVFLLLLIQLPAVIAQQAPTLKIETDLVNLNVVVTDR